MFFGLLSRKLLLLMFRMVEWCNCSVGGSLSSSGAQKVMMNAHNKRLNRLLQEPFVDWHEDLLFTDLPLPTIE